MNDIKDFIKESLFLYPNLHETPFDVLSFLFTYHNNNISLNDQGFITVRNHPDKIKNKSEFWMQKEIEALKAFKLYDPVKSEKEVAESLEKALNYKSRLKDEPVCIKLYPWQESEKLQSFRRFKGCKCKDFIYYLDYFCDHVRQAKLEDLTLENMGMRNNTQKKFIQEDLNIHRQALPQWQKNIDFFRENLI